MNPTHLLFWSAAWTIVGSVILLAAQVVARRFRSASTRHLAWSIAFGTILIFPMLPGTFRGEGVPPSLCSAGSANGSIISTLLIIWIIGIAWNLCRAALAWRTVNRWWKNSVSYESSMNLRGSARVRISNQVDPIVPITWGFRKPVILLPKAAAHWPQERVSTILCHELGHIRRFDNLTQMATFCVCAIHWFNPLFWRSAQQMETEAELAADDFAILRGVKPSNYAVDLLAVASELTTSQWKCPIAQTALANGFSLERRLKAIIDPNTFRGTVTFHSHAIAITVAGAIAIMLSILIPQVKTPSPDPTCLPTDTVPTIHHPL